MIEPSIADIGRSVVYRGHHPGAKLEEGVITSFNDHYVFVRYGADKASKATKREDLEWGASPQEPSAAPGKTTPTLALKEIDRFIAYVEDYASLTSGEMKRKYGEGFDNVASRARMMRTAVQNCLSLEASKSAEVLAAISAIAPGRELELAEALPNLIDGLLFALPSLRIDVERLGNALSGPSITLSMRDEYEGARKRLEAIDALLAKFGLNEERKDG